jgi:hypothetical protein
MTDNQKYLDSEVKPLDPHKYLVRGFFRKYWDQITGLKSVNKKRWSFPFHETVSYLKTVFVDYFSLVILFIVISAFIVAAIWYYYPRKHDISFFDKTHQIYVGGMVYIDGIPIGTTNGSNFNLPNFFCNDTHTIKLSTDLREYEWATYPVDCITKHMTLSLEYETKSLSIYGTSFKFVNSTNDQPITGTILINGNIVQDQGSETFVSAEDCKSITSVEFRIGSVSTFWNKTENICGDQSEILFMIS